eukprot:3073139-Amphidinium_carterae.1
MAVFCSLSELIRTLVQKGSRASQSSPASPPGSPLSPESAVMVAGYSVTRDSRGGGGDWAVDMTDGLDVLRSPTRHPSHIASMCLGARRLCWMRALLALRDGSIHQKSTSNNGAKILSFLLQTVLGLSVDLAPFCLVRWQGCIVHFPMVCVFLEAPCVASDWQSCFRCYRGQGCQSVVIPNPGS